MSDSNSVFSRLGNWFRRTSRDNNSDLPLMYPPDEGHRDQPVGGASGQIVESPKSTFLRPWARQEAALHNLQHGFGTLTDLMAGIRENLEKNSQRQDELLEYLSHLPQALQSIPESARVQGETLKAINQQLTGQSLQQNKLIEILGKMGDSSVEQRGLMDNLREQVESMRTTDQAIVENLGAVGNAMQHVSKSSTTSAEVLTLMRDRLDDRDGQLERVLHRQGTRFTVMLAIAIFLSISALVAVSVIGYLMLTRPNGM